MDKDDRSVPLAPEWLRNTTGSGSGSSSGSSNPTHPALSLDAQHSRSRTSKGMSENDSPRSPFSSSNSRRSSTNGNSKNAYGSFNRSHRDKDREKDRERTNYGEPWDPDTDHLSSYSNKDHLRRSQSMSSRNKNETFARRTGSDFKGGSNSIHSKGIGLLSGGGLGVSNSVFNKNFPSLGTEEKQGVPDIGRVPSPGFPSAIQSLPVGNSALIGGEQFKSALADVPNAIISSSSGSFSVQPTFAATSEPGASVAAAGLNMAEALAQAPARARTAPQLPMSSQRLEELAVKQAKILIPMTPSTAKSSALNSADKLKPKTAARSNEMVAPAKGGQLQSSQLHHGGQSHHGGPVKSDASKATLGKGFLVLKSVRENGISSQKDVTSPTGNASSRAANGPLAVATLAVHAPSRSPSNPKLLAGENKVAALDLKSGVTLEKRPSLSGAQSRIAFFNLLKKQNTNSSIAPPDSGTNTSPSTVEKSGDITREVSCDTASPHVVNGDEVTVNGDGLREVQRCPGSGTSVVVSPDEEEAFLRSLGWEENSVDNGEELTVKEINEFYDRVTKVLKSESSLKLDRMLSKLSTLLPHATDFGGVTNGPKSSDSGSEA